MEQHFSSEEEAAKRTYRTMGKKTLDPAEEWTDVTDESDFDAARANGVFSVGVEWGYGRPDELAEADVTVSLPCELRAAVQ